MESRHDELMDARETTPGKAPNKALTIPARKLLSSPACLNCGTELKGPFCYYCGQPDKNLLRFFPALVRDLLEDVIDLDSRFVRTLKPLLLHPGKLTRDYLDGRRFRYVPPMRLYIFSSMAFFILATTLAGNAIDIIGNADGKPGGIHLVFDEDDVKELESVKALEGTDAGTAIESAIGTEEAKPETAGADQPGTEGQDEDDTIIFNGKPWNRETNPMIIPGMPDFINDWINDEIEESPQKGREIEANPGLIVDKIFDVLPVAVFVMLPLVALLFKFWYLFARKYYVEHLIHALHNHAFLFLIFILTLLADSIANWLDPSESGRPSEIASWITIVLLSWIPLYLLISLKTVYRQGWTMTLAKFSLIGISYVVLLSLVTSAAAVAGFILL
jgi:Protein of unknown function (DUF3667)